MVRRFVDLDVVVATSLPLYVLCTIPGIPSVLAGSAGATLCLAVTGITVAQATLPGRLRLLDRAVAVLASALGAAIVGGVLLNMLPVGLTRLSWATFALVLGILAYAVGRWRGAGQPVRCPRPWRPSPMIAAKLAASMLFLGAAVGVSIVSAEGSGNQPFTEVWLLPDGPSHSPVRTTSAVVGVKSHETSTEDFTVVTTSARQQKTNRVVLSPNQVWTQKIPVDGVQASVAVYRGAPIGLPYRAVWLVTR
jgi:hypothetical protein